MTIPAISRSCDYNIYAFFSGVEFGGCVMDNDQLQMVIGNENVHSNQSDSEPGSEAGMLYFKIRNTQFMTYAQYTCLMKQVINECICHSF